MSRHCLALLLLLSCSVLRYPAAQAAAPDATSGGTVANTQAARNVALGATYTLQPQPSYALCSDPGDRTQLTDGAYTQGYFWSQPSTVGWSNAKRVIITLDLGQTRPIRGLALSTAAGTAGVSWPMAIRIYVGDQQRRFREAGDLLGLSAKNGEPDPQRYGVHRYWTDSLRTHGRYVALVVTNQPFTFIDEIEVFAGDPAWLTTPVPGDPITDVAAHTAATLTRDAIHRRLRHDSAAIREKAAKPDVPAATRAAVTAALDAVAQAMATDTAPTDDTFQAVLPLNPLHRRIFACQALLWAAEGASGLTCWQSPLWEPLSHLADPGADAGPNLHVAMMRGEYRAAAFNLSNRSALDAVAGLRIDGLPGGTNPDYVTVHEVAWTDTASGLPVASALPEAGRNESGWQIDVPAGMTRQVWFTFHPVDVEAGTYTGRVELDQGADHLSVPITFDLYPQRFPDTPSLGFGGWDYTDGDGHRGVNPENRTPLIAHLRQHFVNAPWATNRVIPRGSYDAGGLLTATPETKDFDQWIARWPQASHYCIFAAVGTTFDRWPLEAPEFQTAVGQWATFWCRHAAERGIDPAQLNVLLVDEPHTPEQDATIVAWARAIKESGADLTIWEDPTYHSMSESQQAMVDAVDVLCPNRVIYLRGNAAYRDFFRQQRARGKRLEFYSCSGPSTLLDPYSYYRLQAWTCWKEGASASYFWAFGDNAGVSSWNEYLAPRNVYTLSFLDDTSVIPAKMMAAAREGVEDYEYFVLLKEAVERAPAGPARKEAERLLSELPDAVLERGVSPGLMWHDPIDRTRADAGRIAILKALQALEGAP